MAKRMLLLILALLLLTPVCIANGYVLQGNAKNVAAVKEGSFIKTANNKTVYWVQDGKRHAIPDEATLHSKWHNPEVVTVAPSVVDALPLGSPIPSVLPKEGSLIKTAENKTVYLVEDGKRHAIPDEATLHSKWHNPEVVTVEPSVVDAFPLGNPIPSDLKKH